MNPAVPLLPIENIDPRSELKAIARLTDAALDALADEHEADLRRAVVELHTRAALLLHLVSTW